MNRQRRVGYAIALGMLCLGIVGCAGTVKVSRWAAPPSASYDSVYNAALAAATANQFTVVSQDRAAGVMSLRKEEYAGDKMAERRMSVRIKQAGDKVEVSTTTSGSDFGVIEGSLGGLVNEGLTNKFYVNLFRELDITDPAARNVVVSDAQ